MNLTRLLLVIGLSLTLGACGSDDTVSVADETGGTSSGGGSSSGGDARVRNGSWHLTCNHRYRGLPERSRWTGLERSPVNPCRAAGCRKTSSCASLSNPKLAFKPAR